MMFQLLIPPTKIVHDYTGLFPLTWRNIVLYMNTGGPCLSSQENIVFFHNKMFWRNIFVYSHLLNTNIVKTQVFTVVVDILAYVRKTLIHTFYKRAVSGF